MDFGSCAMLKNIKNRKKRMHDVFKKTPRGNVADEVKSAWLEIYKNVKLDK